MNASSTYGARAAFRRTAVPLLGIALVISLSAGCAARSKGGQLAKEALRCERLDAVFPTPHRYMNESHGDIYRGCGRYALVRCMIQSTETVCAIEEVVSEEQARQPPR